MGAVWYSIEGVVDNRMRSWYQNLPLSIKNHFIALPSETRLYLEVIRKLHGSGTHLDSYSNQYRYQKTILTHFTLLGSQIIQTSIQNSTFLQFNRKILFPHSNGSPQKDSKHSHNCIDHTNV